MQNRHLAAEPGHLARTIPHQDLIPRCLRCGHEIQPQKSPHARTEVMQARRAPSPVKPAAVISHRAWGYAAW